MIGCSIVGVNFFQGDQNSSVNSLYIGKSSQPSGTANNNVSLGVSAFGNLVSGDNNIAIGYNAANTMNTGSSNICIGLNAGNIINTGSQNTIIGNNSGSTITTGSNNIVLGNGATASSATTTNEVTLGNSSVDTLRCGTISTTSISDQRDKINISDLNCGVDFLNMLRPVEFEWQMRELSEYDKNCSENGTKQIGFLAQELQSATEDQNTLNLVYESNPERLEIRQGHLVPTLSKLFKS